MDYTVAQLDEWDAVITGDPITSHRDYFTGMYTGIGQFIEEAVDAGIITGEIATTPKPATVPAFIGWLNECGFTETADRLAYQLKAAADAT